MSREVIEKYAQAVYEQCVDIGRKLAESYGLVWLIGWPCQFRINKYNYTPESVGFSGVQLHTDSGFLTILQDDENVGGLEVMDKFVDPCPGTLLINFGHVAQAWSNGRLCNVKHRVQCREATTRVLIATFLLVPKEEAVEALPEFVDSKYPRLYVPFTYEDYRKLRLSTKMRAGHFSGSNSAMWMELLTVFLAKPYCMRNRVLSIRDFGNQTRN
ncbi:hypothetical protein DVH24_017014 [Malus domestica]|uniref:Fe2OG dioxygenase domain-containing protein n=1 Tax=Malus domestica TaxID=3750 RepID=A0A498IXE6_MALDO|nr:hypothetical protein DVH24_017014 [Malus domestica]